MELRDEIGWKATLILNLLHAHGFKMTEESSILALKFLIRMLELDPKELSVENTYKEIDFLLADKDN